MGKIIKKNVKTRNEIKYQGDRKRIAPDLSL